MFKSIRLQNFKGYKDSGEVSLAPLTIIVGPNNSGKSTLLQSLLALKQTAREPANRPALITRGIVDLNGFYDILYGKESGGNTSFRIALAVEGVGQIRFVTAGATNKPGLIALADSIDITFAFDQKSNEIEVASVVLMQGEKIALRVVKGRNDWQSETLAPSVPRNMQVEFRNFLPSLTLAVPQETNPLMMTPEIFDAITATKVYAHFWSQWLGEGIKQVGPLRRAVPWHASAGATASAEFGLGGENLVAALGSKEKVADTNRTLLELVSDWVSQRKILKNLHLEVNRAKTGTMLLGDDPDGLTNINVAGMGQGLSQVLPVIASSKTVAPNDCLLVEQPEVHLHPALQSELGDLFIDAVSTAQRQVIVETHSEHLVLRVRRRVAERKLSPEHVAILYVEKQGPNSTIRRLQLNERGHFADWPKGFFDEAYQEAMALSLASNKRV